MNMSKKCLVTVQVDAQFERAVCHKLRSWGADSYTVMESRVSVHVAHDNTTAEVKRIRIEALVDDEVAREIVEGLQAESFSEGAISYFVSDVLTSFPSTEAVRTRSGKAAVREERWGDYLITA